MSIECRIMELSSFASQNAKGHPSAVTMPVRNLWSALVRRKYYHSVTETKLERCLSVFDLTFLGVGSTLGLGIYVLAGQVASTKAGPAVTLSFMVAAFASIFSALCYAEFGARVPRAGSAYVYSYVTVGEFMAFIIGWNLILEYVIGTASVARGYSGYLDFLLNGTIKSHLTQSLPMSLDGLSSYPDFLALGITVLLTVMLALGVKESTSFNNVFTCSNLLVVLYAVITGSFKADVKNWKLNKSQIPADAGSGGFFPFGFSGMMSGASTCFYAYVGFDCIATTGEEAKNPQRAIPLSILVSLFIVFCAYFGISAIQTLMWPYYDQNQSAPLPYVFDQVGWPVAKWIISVGALAGLSTSLLGAMFPLPRILYAMASDGLIFKFLANIHSKFKTPFIATILSGLFAGVMAMMFDVHELAAMMSIGTLLAYTLVAVSVLILRYRILEERIPLSPFLNSKNSAPVISQQPDVSTTSKEKIDGTDPSANTMFQDASLDSQTRSLGSSTATILSSTEHYTPNQLFRMIFNCDNTCVRSTLSSKISVYLIGIICILLLVVDLLLVTCEKQLLKGSLYAVLPLSFMVVVTLTAVLALKRQPSDSQELSFQVPYVPLIPVTSIFINMYLMLKLPKDTWYRFAVWMFIGFLLYFMYGIQNSSQAVRSCPVLPSICETSDNEEEDGDTKRGEHSPLLRRML